MRCIWTMCRFLRILHADFQSVSTSLPSHQHRKGGRKIVTIRGGEYLKANSFPTKTGQLHICLYSGCDHMHMVCVSSIQTKFHHGQGMRLKSYAVEVLLTDNCQGRASLLSLVVWPLLRSTFFSG